MRRLIIGKRGEKVRNLNRRRAIRHHCLACSGFDWDEVVNCRRCDCRLFQFRLGNAGGDGPGAEMRKEAIRRFCRTCLGAGAEMECDCSTPACSLFEYRK
jgi:hypothetical protein